MKEYLLTIFIVVLVGINSYQSSAQSRPYPESYSTEDEYERSGSTYNSPSNYDGMSIHDFNMLELVDEYGNPSCCELEDREFDFDLKFTNFSYLLALESAISQAYRSEVDRWLRNQEEVFRKEINKLMNKSYSSFATAQKEYFKFYEAGIHGALGPVLRTSQLEGAYTNSYKAMERQAGTNLAEYDALDKWIECGYCEEYRTNAWAVNNLGDYDSDTTPSPAFYAKFFREDAREAFIESYYNSGVEKSMANGFSNILQKGDILERLSNTRVQHYRGLGWQDKVFQMSAYLMITNTSCNAPNVCIPWQLREYTPPILWDDEKLKDWAEDYATPVVTDRDIFGNDYILSLLNHQQNGLILQQHGPDAAIQMADSQRQAVMDSYIDPRNNLCGYYNWRTVGSSNSVSIRGLRAIAKNKLHTWIPISIGETTYNLPTICVSIPNFKFEDGIKRRITQSESTAKFNLAWSSALFATYFELQGKIESQVFIPTTMLANLELILNRLVPGSKVSRGACSGSNIMTSNAKFCK